MFNLAPSSSTKKHTEYSTAKNVPKLVVLRSTISVCVPLIMCQNNCEDGLAGTLNMQLLVTNLRGGEPSWLKAGHSKHVEKLSKTEQNANGVKIYGNLGKTELNAKHFF